MGEPSLQVAGVLGPDFLHRLLGAQFSSSAEGMGNQTCWLAPSLNPLCSGNCGFCLRRDSFLWHFRLKVAGHVIVGSMELQIPVCARKEDLPLRG
jgi:hypothetical protein